MKLSRRFVPSSPVSRATVQDRVYLQIKDLIATGGIEAGQSVTIPAIAAAFGVSHMPVREALHRLVAERALTTISGRSLGIPPLSLDRLKELRKIRIEIEGFATEMASAHMDGPTVAKLEGLVTDMGQAIESNDVKTFLRSNRDFHFTIYAAAGSPILLSIIESLWLQVSPYFSTLYPLGDYPRSNRQHAAIAHALSRDDGQAARLAVGSDIDGAAQALELALATGLHRTANAT